MNAPEASAEAVAGAGAAAPSTARSPLPLPDPLHRNRVYRGFQLLAQGAFVLGFDFRARGMEHIPAGGGLVLSSHRSFLDPLLVGVGLDRPISFVARHSLFRVPVVGWILRNTYVMPINRESAGSESIREASRRLKHGFLVGMFPEGTRSRDGRLGPIKPGFIAILRQAGVPIIPAAIAGADRAMPRGALLPRCGRIRVVYGDPIPLDVVAQLSRRGSEPELVNLVRQRIEACQSEADRWRDETSGR